MTNQYQLLSVNGEIYLWLHCDLEMALTVERTNLWQCGEPVNTDNGFLYLVREHITQSILCLINYGFEEHNHDVTIFENMGERLTLFTTGSHMQTLQNTYGWPYGSPYCHSNRVGHYLIENDADIIYSELERFMVNNGLKVLEF